MKVQLLIGVATIIVATLVMLNGARSTNKVDRAGRRAEWWRRTQWAIDLALSEDAGKQEVGVLALGALLDSELAEQDDLAVAKAAMTAIVPDTG